MLNNAERYQTRFNPGFIGKDFAKLILQNHMGIQEYILGERVCAGLKPCSFISVTIEVNIKIFCS